MRGQALVVLVVLLVLSALSVLSVLLERLSSTVTVSAVRVELVQLVALLGLLVLPTLVLPGVSGVETKKQSDHDKESSVDAAALVVHTLTDNEFRPSWVRLTVTNWSAAAGASVDLDG